MMPFIGEDRAIHHTLRILQTFGQMVTDTPEDVKLLPRRGFFGPTPWTPGRSRKVHGDLDELLMADILPEMLIMFRYGIWAKVQLPMAEEIAPFWLCLHNYFTNPGKAVSWSITFAVHAMLTGILETDKTLNAIMSASETTFGNYFKALSWAKCTSDKEDDFLHTRSFEQNMVMIYFLQNLGREEFGSRAVWNPLFGGTIFSYTFFYANLEGGCALIDCHSQLRIVLHLYNGLRVNGIIRQDDIPFLDYLYEGFKASRAIWEGPPPSKGGLVQRFWMCFGLNATDAKKMAEESRQCVVRMNDISPTATSINGRSRKMSMLEPAEISKSYRRVCNRDFHDVVDKYHSEEQRRRMKGTDVYRFAVRVNDTLDAISDEQIFLSCNLPVSSVVLELFVCSLCRVMQWNTVLDRAAGQNKNDKRQCAVYMFAQYLLGTLDFSSDPLNHMCNNVPMGLASSHFMKSFFFNLNPQHVLWYQPTRS